MNQLSSTRLTAENQALPLFTPTVYRRSDEPAQLAKVREPHDPLMRWGLLQIYGVELLDQEAEEIMEPLKTLPERLAELLVTQGVEQGGAISGLRLQTIADYLGTHRETIASILRVFARQHLVALGRGRIELVDLASLRELAGMDDWGDYIANMQAAR